MQFQPIKVIDIELSRPIEDLQGFDGYSTARCLVRLKGFPVGCIDVPLSAGCCRANDLVKKIVDKHSRQIIHHLVRLGLTGPVSPEGINLKEMLTEPCLNHGDLHASVTVAVCTRDRTSYLSICLAALDLLDYPELEILVIDNAPSDDSTERLVRTSFPGMRYVKEPRPGLNWARNRAILEARGDIIAYTDDDVVVDPMWISALARIFSEDAEVMAVTGLVVPFELETEAQFLFEFYGGFGKGFQRAWHRFNRNAGKQKPIHLGAGRFGTGANMAFRRSLFDAIGGFDPALDVGTVTNGGGDLEMFFRVIQEGYTLVYEPGAFVRHRHRRDYPQLKNQLTNNGIGFYSYCVRSYFVYPGERISFLRFGLWWLWWWSVRRLLISLSRPTRFPRDLILAEFRGSLTGLFRYQAARRNNAKIVETFGEQENLLSPPICQPQSARPLKQTAVCAIDLKNPIQLMTTGIGYAKTRVFVKLHGRLLGKVDIANYGQAISVPCLREKIADAFASELMEPGGESDSDSIFLKAREALSQHYSVKNKKACGLPKNHFISIVVATLDRPAELRACLRCLVAQSYPWPTEIIVVDNNPTSGKTPNVVSDFRAVTLVNEIRRGVSYARNKGYAVSTGDIVVTVDDDVEMEQDWLVRLLAPFARSDVMAVTGNVLPIEMKTPAQVLFETYGGLGRGYQYREYGRQWFESFKFRAVPTWELGGTANAAFRAKILSDPSIGMLDETLGPGMPTGVGEDTYLFYKILEAGHTIAYQPDAFVWHKHRSDMKALRRQIYNYSKGHVAYHLETLFREKDLRAALQLLIGLPKGHLWRLKKRLMRKEDYPLRLLFLEILGNFVGPYALIRAHRRVRREGRSEPYLPVAARLGSAASPRHGATLV